ncbi:MAG: hypothetical protein QOJ99_3719, partial [Bryobacterales bacterium]|nr:hypothetical protein [Bryobacterales bacterium]
MLAIRTLIRNYFRKVGFATPIRHMSVKRALLTCGRIQPEELRSGAEATQGGKEPGASAIIVKAGQAANTARLDTGGPFDP